MSTQAVTLSISKWPCGALSAIVNRDTATPICAQLQTALKAHESSILKIWFPAFALSGATFTALLGLLNHDKRIEKPLAAVALFILPMVSLLSLYQLGCYFQISRQIALIKTTFPPLQSAIVNGNTATACYEHLKTALKAHESSILKIWFPAFALPGATLAAFFPIKALTNDEESPALKLLYTMLFYILPTVSLLSLYQLGCLRQISNQMKLIDTTFLELQKAG